MAFIATSTFSQVQGAVKEVLETIALDNSYPAGGYILTPATFGLTVLRALDFSTFTTLAGAAYQECLIPTYNTDGATIASAALRLVVGTTGVEVATATNVSAVSCQVIARGN